MRVGRTFSLTVLTGYTFFQHVLCPQALPSASARMREWANDSGWSFLRAIEPATRSRDGHRLTSSTGL